MALTRAFLKSLGIEDDKVTSIIEAHTEVTNGLIADRDRYKAEADKLPGVQKELDDLKQGDYKGKYEQLFSDVEKGKARAAKETAVKAYYEGKNIKGGNLTIALRGTDLDSLEVDDAGKLKDTAALDALVAGDFKPLIGGDGSGFNPLRVVSSGGKISRGDNQSNTANDVMNRLIRGA